MPMMKPVAVLVTILMSAPSFALAQGRETDRSKRMTQRIPPEHVPPPGKCRVWIDGRLPGRQPKPTDCPAAERRASRTRNARVIRDDGSDGSYTIDGGQWGDDTERQRQHQRDDPWHNAERRDRRG